MNERRGLDNYFVAYEVWYLPLESPTGEVRNPLQGLQELDFEVLMQHGLVTNGWKDSLYSIQDTPPFFPKYGEGRKSSILRN